MEEKLKITITPEGHASVEVIGGQGESCLDATHEIEKAMGEVALRRKKPEFYQVVPTHQQRIERT